MLDVLALAAPASAPAAAPLLPPPCCPLLLRSLAVGLSLEPPFNRLVLAFSVAVAPPAAPPRFFVAFFGADSALTLALVAAFAVALASILAFTTTTSLVFTSAATAVAAAILAFAPAFASAFLLAAVAGALSFVLAGASSPLNPSSSSSPHSLTQLLTCRFTFRLPGPRLLLYFALLQRRHAIGVLSSVAGHTQAALLLLPTPDLRAAAQP